MKETILNKQTLKVIFGFLFIGGAVAVFNIYHTAKDVRHSFKSIQEEYDGDLFV